jgi:hypothetical protein
MKKILFITVANLIMVSNCFSQPAAKNNYLKKSKHKKIAAWVLAGAGAGAIITGIILDANNSGPDTEYYTGGFIAAPGIVVAAVSIPFFIGAAKDKKRSMALSFKDESVPKLQYTGLSYKALPALSLKIGL